MNRSDLMQAQTLSFGQASIFRKLPTQTLPPPSAAFVQQPASMQPRATQAPSFMASSHELVNEHVKEQIGPGFSHGSLLEKEPVDPRQRRPRTTEDEQRDGEPDNEPMDECD